MCISYYQKAIKGNLLLLPGDMRVQYWPAFANNLILLSIVY
jgi:hypothetical protein